MKDRSDMLASTLPTILIVEDQPLLRNLIARMIRPAFPDYPIYTCPTSADAYDYILHTSVACVITDYVLPADDGVMLSRTLHMFWPHLPIILISGVPPVHEVLGPAHFVAVLPKPIPFTTLTTLLQRVLQPTPSIQAERVSSST